MTAVQIEIRQTQSDNMLSLYMKIATYLRNFVTLQKRKRTSQMVDFI